MKPDAQWLDALFSNYDLYYLDPLVIKDVGSSYSPPAKRTRSWMSRLSGQEEKPASVPWYESDIAATCAVLEKVHRILRVDETNQDVSQFFEGDILANLSEDRGMQKQIVDVLINGLRPAASPRPKDAENTPKPGDRGMPRRIMDALGRGLRSPVSPEMVTVHQNRKPFNLSDLDGNLKSFQQMPNRNTVECLVALEGMITCVDTESNSELYQSVSVTSRHEDRHARTVRFCLAERPGLLMTLDDRRVGLMVDQKGLTKTYPSETTREGVVNAVALDGWYPFAMAIGFWRTDRGGRPFIDVLAILIKAFPSLDTILKQRAGSNQCSFVQMLQNGRSTAEERKDALLANTPYDPKDDYRLLYPYFLATLCCHLNNTDWANFKARGRVLYDLSEGYWKALVELSNEIEAKNADSWLPDLVRSVERKRREIVQK